MAQGQIAFTAVIRSPARPGDNGVFLAAAGSPPEVLAPPTRPPQTLRARPMVDSPCSTARIRVNDAGHVAFQAQNLLGTSRGASNDTGIFRWTAGSVTTIAREGQRVATLGEFDDMQGDNAISLNGTGVVAFSAYLRGTAGGDDDDRGIFESDGRDIIVVAREGDRLEGSTIVSLGLSADGLNDLGQVAFTARLANGHEGVFLFTPTLGYRGNAGSRWDDPANWTLGLAPASVHDVALRPEKGFELIGPSKPTIIKSLRIGPKGPEKCTLKLDAGSLLVRETLAISPRGRLEVGGVLRVEGTLANAGEIVNLGGRITVREGLSNEAGGTISGRGTFGLGKGPTGGSPFASPANPRIRRQEPRPLRGRVRRDRLENGMTATPDAIRSR